MWQVPRWAVAMLLASFLPPVLLGLWVVVTFPGNDWQTAAVDAQDEALAQLQTEAADVVHLQSDLNPVYLSALEGPVPERTIKLAETCLEGRVSEWRDVMCAWDGEEVSGAEATLLLSTYYREELAVSTRRASVEALHLMANSDVLLTSGMMEWRRALIRLGLPTTALSIVLICFAFLGGVTRKPWAIQVRQNGLFVEGEWIAAADIVDCKVRGQSLILTLVGGKSCVVGPTLAPLSVLEDVAAAVARICLTPAGRDEEDRARKAIRRRHGELAERLPASG